MATMPRSARVQRNPRTAFSPGGTVKTDASISPPPQHAVTKAMHRA